MSCGQVDRYGGMPQGGILPRPGEVGQTGKGGGGQSWPAGEGPASGPDQNGIDGSNGQGTPCNGCGGGKGGGGGSGSGSGSSPGVGGANGANGANGPGGATAPGAKGGSNPQEKALVDAINQARAERNLKPLTIAPNLSTAAAQNNAASQSMGMGHHIPLSNNNGRSENTAMASDGESVASALQQWIGSVGHAQNMFSADITQIGASIDGNFATATFA
jgi:hypothetical protein